MRSVVEEEIRGRIEPEQPSETETQDGASRSCRSTTTRPGTSATRSSGEIRLSEQDVTLKDVEEAAKVLRRRRRG